ncbi:hypothetical protein Fleli_0673 [Bernardetia litoralis DSM 6794]|uniref:Uncharacterized protein n=1 Tax=Bernardetia litoralis (strain ATCC 23117 / DSM 6794 / NBRC 15988 / NCIMB 1366 / Fx l1 / Sio-4) TaxID=880071 RepID=I4AGQ1_BERLS|nr:hypothetical protein [Bernardetia litoralis]AFM03136.1 hypothetical protein Fleli_0673 [Bernardetia litoralis DSM 6794]
MNSTKLNITNNLISNLDIVFIENNIKKYVNDFQSTFIFILAIPFLYISLFFTSLIISYNFIKRYKKYMNFKDAHDYKELRLLYDFTTENKEKIAKILTNIKNKNKMLYYFFYPSKLIFFGIDKYEIKAMKRFKSLDTPTKEGALFRSISEEELWKRRNKMYEYKL